ncbi:Cystathionine gamma-synthase [Zalerion maritima]|uniref:cystathionine gamma-synthase n=1 Tax=Zalerion maritima TaxID=339359 RepID=A0AAD5WU92_9PEZI|nr:Cystathionine gamma-synthase [Zalerion maritima]
MTVPNFTLGESIPSDTAHAVSVSLPTWRSNVGYEEGESWVIDNMTTGYPRFFVHKSIQALVQDLISRYGPSDQGKLKAIALPQAAAAKRCVDFIRQRELDVWLSVVNLQSQPGKETSIKATVSVVICRSEAFPLAKQYWQHTGDGISSRRADFCHKLLKEGSLAVVGSSIVSASNSRTSTPGEMVLPSKAAKGPRRYQRQSHPQTHSKASIDKPPSPPRDRAAAEVVDESSQFLEERFGRNLDLSLVTRAESAIKRRIAGALRHEDDVLSHTEPLPSISTNSRGIDNLRESDIYLFSCGMNAIFNAHRALLGSRGQMKSVSFGFPYVDTLKILQKFGPGCFFYGNASEADLDDLEEKLKLGEKLLGLFCEFPGNPLLTCPNLPRIRQLADTYDFAVVVDETIGTFANINVLQHSDIVVSSLTKIFSGDCNVMGGSAVLNPNSRYYSALKRALDDDVYEDNYWPEDIIFMERNSRDFASRVERINTNSEAICEVLLSSSTLKRVYYPKYVESKPNYEAVRVPGAGYGGLLSVTFKEKAQSVAFYDALATAKGPSLGTNFTLTSPYVVLAHYNELDWARGFGVDPDLVRVSVGLEQTNHLVEIFKTALTAAEKAGKETS